MSDKTDKNEPGRFLGEGVSFRAKLIGVLEVPEARGDRMCQEALCDLKMAIRAAGEHKQRIQVHVAIDGLRLRDDKTGDSLYHHPVHKISFIAQDMTDSRAFGYIFGSPDTGHRFFGIKTDKAASQVVIAMRDLFQVVFELKKKEVEMAKQQLEGKNVSSLTRHIIATLEPKVKTVPTTGETSTTTSKPTDTGAEGGVAELVDLEQELCSLRRGLTQVEGLTPSTDPFGDSFIAPTSQKGLIPPPPSGSSTRGRNTPATASRALFSPSKQPATLPFDIAPATSDFEPAPVTFDTLTTTNTEPTELKNPPKKVLKDLVPTQTVMSEKGPVPEESRSDHYGPATTMTSLTRHSGGSVAVARSHQPFMFQSDPFAETDPFDSADPFSESFKEDPFTTMQEFPKSSFIRPEDLKSKPVQARELKAEPPPVENGRSVFNGPLQVSLPPEPAPKSPRLQRQGTDSSTVRQRPQGRLPAESASPPPPLPPKKCVEVGGSRPPPRPPLDHDDEEAPPLPRPARKKEPAADRSMKPRLSSAATNSSEEEYLTPAPPPLPAARRFDITLTQLLTCSVEELATRLRVPAVTLSSMTLPQLTEYLRSYLAADNERAHIHVDPPTQSDKKPLTALPTPPTKTTTPIDKPKPSAPSLPALSISSEFKPQFEDNFTPPIESSETFVANFDDFDQKANPSYDRYAAFREIQEQELKAKSILDPVENEPKQDSDEKEELAAIDDMMKANQGRESETKDTSRSPLKTLDELTIDSFNMFRSSVSPKPSQIDAKIEDIKSVMKNFQIDSARRSVSPRDNGHVDVKQEDTNDRYAALREITITEPPADEFESLPPEVPKERKKSDEKSDGFDNSDFFDCIDNSSLSFTHVEDAFRKSPVVKEREERKVEEKKEVHVELAPVRELEPPARLSTGSISDVVSGSSPDTKEKCVSVKMGVGGGSVAGGARWAVLGGAGGSAGSSDSRDSEPRVRRRVRHHSPQRVTNARPMVQTSSSSRDVSPWEEDLPPVARMPRPPSHHRDRESSRHNSSGSRECLDSGSGREKDKLRDKRDMRERDMSRDGRESGRDRRDSGSGRDRRDSKERDRRRHRDADAWDRDRDRPYRDRDYRDSRSRERQKDYRDKDRERHRKPRHSYDEQEDYSDGCGSGRSSPRERWSDQRWRRDERNYGSLGWRETRRRAEMRQQSDDASDRRYGGTVGWATRRRREDRSRERGEREARRRPRRDEPRRRDYRFSSDFSHSEPFEPAFPDPPAPNGKKRAPYTTLDHTRFAFEPEEGVASPLSGSSARARDGDSPAARFRFDSDSISPRSMFEDDFTALSTPRGRTASIAEEDEDVPPLRPKPQSHRDIKKSESINIFTRESDPFEGDAFFACTGSDRVARRENWPGDFQGFDNA